MDTMTQIKLLKKCKNINWKKFEKEYNKNWFNKDIFEKQRLIATRIVDLWWSLYN